MDMSDAEVKRAALAPSAANAVAATPPADPNGAEILVRCLQAENVKFLWGYPGGAVLYIYDALYKQNTIEHVLVRHEQARSMRPMATPERPAKSVWRWSLPGLA